MHSNDIPLPTLDEIETKSQELQNSKNYSYQDNDVDQVYWNPNPGQFELSFLYLQRLVLGTSSGIDELVLHHNSLVHFQYSCRHMFPRSILCYRLR